MVSNRSIDNIIINGEWHIDYAFAMEQLMAYLEDMEMLEKGVPLSELGFAKRKAASLPEIFVPTSSGYRLDASDKSQSSLSNTDKIPKKSFAILKLSGVMRSEDGWCSYGMDTFADWIAQIDANPNIAGLMIKGRSGGGEKLAGQILKNALLDFSKPKIAYGDMFGSAAIEGILPVDEVIGSGPSATFGSIGVYASIDKRVKEFYNKYIEDIYASTSPQKNLEFREYLKGNNAPIQKSIDKSAKSFHDEVLKFRPDVAKYPDTLEGGMFDAKEAKKRGLVDAIGTFQFAMSRLAFLANVR